MPEKNKTHGLSLTQEYRAWQTMRLRCGNPANAACAIAEQVLLALAQHELGAFSLSGAGGVWVEPDMEAAALQ